MSLLRRAANSAGTVRSIAPIFVLSIGLLSWSTATLAAQSPTSGISTSNAIVPAAYRALVPHRLLALVHDAAVHTELKLTSAEVKALEEFLPTVDGPWFRARILTAEKQWPVLDETERQFLTWAASHWSADKIKRLRQLECQAQGGRMLLRTDIARELKLSDVQQKKFAELAKSTDSVQAALQEAIRKQEDTTALESSLKSAAEAEQKAVAADLSVDQRKRLSNWIGPIFDTRGLERIYPLAPELSVGDEWINSEPQTLKSLRGKVVLVHFYAFQCHNCHANFAIYRRWHETLRAKGVVVIGVQSPETAQERNPAAVRAAAIEKKLDFPILIDTKMNTWNAWANTMWPTVYVVDKRGYLRHWWQGELNWQGATGDKTIEKVVDAALAESILP